MNLSNNTVRIIAVAGVGISLVGYGLYRQQQSEENEALERNLYVQPASNDETSQKDNIQHNHIENQSKTKSLSIVQDNSISSVTSMKKNEDIKVQPNSSTNNATELQVKRSIPRVDIDKNPTEATIKEKEASIKADIVREKENEVQGSLYPSPKQSDTKALHPETRDQVTAVSDTGLQNKNDSAVERETVTEVVIAEALLPAAEKCGAATIENGSTERVIDHAQESHQETSGTNDKTLEQSFGGIVDEEVVKKSVKEMVDEIETASMKAIPHRSSVHSIKSEHSGMDKKVMDVSSKAVTKKSKATVNAVENVGDKFKGMEDNGIPVINTENSDKIFANTSETVKSADETVDVSSKAVSQNSKATVDAVENVGSIIKGVEDNGTPVINTENSDKIETNKSKSAGKPVEEAVDKSSNAHWNKSKTNTGKTTKNNKPYEGKSKDKYASKTTKENPVSTDTIEKPTANKSGYKKNKSNVVSGVSFKNGSGNTKHTTVIEDSGTKFSKKTTSHSKKKSFVAPNKQTGSKNPTTNKEQQSMNKNVEVVDSIISKGPQGKQQTVSNQNKRYKKQKGTVTGNTNVTSKGSLSSDSKPETSQSKELPKTKSMNAEMLNNGNSTVVDSKKTGNSTKQKNGKSYRGRGRSSYRGRGKSIRGGNSRGGNRGRGGYKGKPKHTKREEPSQNTSTS